jgi:hypothetical protein
MAERALRCRMDTFFGAFLIPGGMAEAAANTLAGMAGAIVGIAYLRLGQRTGPLDAWLVGPLAAYVARLRRPAPTEQRRAA